MATTLSTTIYEYAPESESGFIICSASSDKVGFYGKAPVARRAFDSDAQKTVATSSSFGATQAAVVNEVVATLQGLGIWATA